jgi:hypothetical protein
LNSCAARARSTPAILSEERIEAPGEKACHRAAALAADREGDGAEGQGHAAADRLDPLLPG